MRKITALLLIVCCLPSCVKEIDVFLPDDPAFVNSAFKHLFENIQPLSQTFQVSAHRDTTLNSVQGIRIFIPAGAFTTPAGVSVDGMVEVRFSEAFKKGSWVANRMSTTTQTDLFEHLGAVNIRATKNDVQLGVSPGAKLRFDIPRTAANEQARLFRGVSDQENKIRWLDINDQTGLAQSEVFDGTTQQWMATWQWETSAIGWFACGRYLPATTEASTFCVTLPEDFDETNTAAFAVFQHKNSIVELEWRVSTRQFCTPFIPVGQTVTLLSISAKDQNHYLGYAETTLEDFGLVIPLQPIGTTPAIFAELLDEL